MGYVHGHQCFDAMAKAGRLGRFNQWFSKELPKKQASHTLSEYSFVDLAQIVCKVPEMRMDRNYLSSSDEEFDGYISEPTTLVRCVNHIQCVMHLIYYCISSIVIPRYMALNALVDHCRYPKTKWTPKMMI